MASIKILRLQKELIKLFNSKVIYKLRDERLSGIYFSDVVVTSDLRLAKIYFNNPYSDLNKNEMVNILTKASGQFKKIIAEAKLMRIIPDLHFYYDNTQENVEKINSLLDAIKEDEDE